MNVAVIGAGTAGCAAAIFLARAGHEVRLFERVPEPGPVGAGIVLQPTGMAVLARLGLREAVVPRGARLSGLEVRDVGGRVIVRLDYARLAEGLFGVGLHRGALFTALWQAARGACETATGVGIVGIQPHAPGGRLLVDETGRRYGPFDLVVVADGARSRLAEQVAPWRQSVRYPWGAIWFVAQGFEAQAAPGVLRQVVRGSRRMLGLLPSGEGQVSLYWSVRADRADEARRDWAGWRREVLSMAPEAEPVLDQIESPEQLIFSDYRDVVMWPWDDGDAVVIGDAAHAMSPQLGQGCNLALWDAMVLADCVAEAGSGVASGLPAALDAYSRARRDHLDYYQFASRWLTPLFQGDLWLAGWLRDRLMPLASRLRFVERRMLASMAGTLAGVLGGEVALT